MTNPSNGRPAGETSEARIAKALAHPLRARILTRLGERVASPGDLAVELDAPLGVVSYHVRMLRDYECVELVRTEPRRGALQHFYRATARPTFDPDQRLALPSGIRDDLAHGDLAKLVEDAGESWADGKLADATVHRKLLEVTPRQRKKVQTVIERARREIEAITDEASTGGDVTAIEVGIIAFDRA